MGYYQYLEIDFSNFVYDFSDRVTYVVQTEQIFRETEKKFLKNLEKFWIIKWIFLINWMDILD